MIKIDYKNDCLVDDCVIESNSTSIQSEVSIIKKQSKAYSSPYSFAYLPFDARIRKEVKELVCLQKSRKISICIVIGIGGSNRGTVAIYEALRGVLCNTAPESIKLYFVDSVDSDYVHQLYDLIEQEIKQGKKVVINIVSKSGTTIETMANFDIFLTLIKKYFANYHKFVIVTTNINSFLWNLAEQEGFSRLSIPIHVGGRFSVFSAVSLFPLALAGIDIDLLLKGAREMTTYCVMHNELNIASIGASILVEWYQRGIDIFDLFIFSIEFEGLGKWYRQLVGESLGKKYSRAHEKLEISILPTVSIGTSDLHSMMQRYIGGKHNIGTFFVTIGQEKNHTISSQAPLTILQGKNMDTIMHAIVNSVIESYRKNKLPFIRMHIPIRNEYYCGQFLQYMMITIVYLAYLIRVNPFDQPEVQVYKDTTRKLLKT